MHGIVIRGRHAVSVVATALTLALALAGCKGDKGDTGATGPAGSSCTVKAATGGTTITCPDGTSITVKDGAAGTQGDPGTPGTPGTPGDPGAAAKDTGTITGTLTGDVGGPAADVAVTTTPDVGKSTTSDSAGGFTLTLPIGTYVISLASPNYTKKDLPAISVTGGATITITATLTSNTPIRLAPPVFTKPVAFGSTGQLDITATGGTAPYTYAWTPKTTNPTKAAVSDATAKNPTFPVGKLADVIVGGMAVGLELNVDLGVDCSTTACGAGQVCVAKRCVLARNSFVAVSAQQAAQMSYLFDVKVTDSVGFSATTTVTVPTVTVAQGNTVAALGQTVVLNFPGNAAALTLTKPTASTAVLNEADGPNPWFIPDVKGTYAVGSLSVDVALYVSSNPDCGTCHATDVKSVVKGKFTEWNNSAHGNHFFTDMGYDASGNLVWNNGPDGKPIPAATGDPTIFWSSPGAMTLFEFGMTGGEGTHYSKNCIACHTTGNVALAANGGFADQATKAGWAFPDLKAAFGGDGITKAPVMTAFNAIPDTLKQYNGMQCESCHGPLGNHGPGVDHPKAEWSVGTCAVCHDKPTNHDKVYLWRQSAHASRDLPVEEAVVESRGTSTSCMRCHAAQGFASYLDTKESDPSQLVRPATLPVIPGAASGCTPGTGHTASTDPLDPACPCKTSGSATTCKPAGIYCEPTAGHLQSADDMDPNCPCKPATNISSPATTCAVDADCIAVNADSICVNKACVFKGCAGDVPYYAYLNDLGLNRHDAQPQTCQACHDPHSTELRVSGDTGLLGNGNPTGAVSQVKGAGTGAICMVCHNTRNGARGDFVAIPGSGVSAPHAPVQTDLFQGANAYFMGAGGQASKHMAVSDTCSGCHVKLHPASVTPSGTNHTFNADGTICKACHSEEVGLDGLEGQFMVSRGNLETAMGSAFTSAVGGSSASFYVTAKDQTVGSTKTANLHLTAGPVSIAPQGRTQDLLMTFATAIPDPFDASGTATTTTLLVNFQAVSLTGDVTNKPGAALISKTGIIAKSNWNYWLVSSVTENPAANVIHNPSFVFDVISATSTALLASTTSVVAGHGL